MQIDHPASWPLKFNQILVSTDFSPVCGTALDYAAMLARHFGSRIHVAHALIPEADPGMGSSPAADERRRAAERSIAGIQASGCLRGVNCEFVLEDGYLWPTMVRIIKARGIDLVVTATHGFRRNLKETGSSAELIFRHAEVPVLTVGPALDQASPRAAAWETILFPTDFGRAAQHAAPSAMLLAREFHSHLVLLNVIEENTSFYSESGLATLKETTLLRLKEIIGPAADGASRSAFHVGFGDPAEGILEAARSERAGLIVMGAKAGNNLTAHLPHSVALTTAAAAPCPVLTVRA